VKAIHPTMTAAIVINCQPAGSGISIVRLSRVIEYRSDVS
jgi:hypothetical protein